MNQITNEAYNQIKDGLRIILTAIDVLQKQSNTKDIVTPRVEESVVKTHNKTVDTIIEKTREAAIKQEAKTKQEEYSDKMKLSFEGVKTTGFDKHITNPEDTVKEQPILTVVQPAEGNQPLGHTDCGVPTGSGVVDDLEFNDDDGISDDPFDGLEI